MFSIRLRSVSGPRMSGLHRSVVDGRPFLVNRLFFNGLVVEPQVLVLRITAGSTWWNKRR